MPSFCLVPKLADAFKAKLKSGELDPQKLAEMSSEQRRAAFDFLGPADAHEVNTLFESKLLLKNQQTGMINWAKQVAGMKPEVLRDIVSKVNKMDKLLNPKSEKAFLEDLASKRLGAEVTMEEATKISQMAKDVTEKKGAVKEDSSVGSEDRMAYGRTQVAFQDYMAELKDNNLSLKERMNPKNLGKNISEGAGLAKSMKATFDLSAILRQGRNMLLTHPTIWAKNTLESIKVAMKEFGNKAPMDEIRANIASRPNAINGLYKKEGLAVGVTEEAYPTSVPAKIPILGRFFRASESAFTAFQYLNRADVFDRYVDIAKKTDADITGIGKVSNSLTGRGTFGARGEAAASAVNNIFFSPRLLKSHIDVLTAHALDSGISPFARKQAAINMVKIISGTAGILVLANAIKPGSAETDSRSADFGKIRVGDTRFDYTGGMSSLVTLATRLARGSTKSSTSGKVTELNAKDKKGQPKFGAQTGTDVIYNFMENKLSPAASVVKDMLQGADFQGNKPTLGNEANNLLTPLPITTYLELSKNPNSADIILSMIADALGISTNTYSKK